MKCPHPGMGKEVCNYILHLDCVGSTEGGTVALGAHCTQGGP